MKEENRDLEDFTWVRPNQAQPQSVFSHYYFHRTCHPEFETEIYLFPNHRVTWNVCEHSQVGWRD